MANTPKEHDEQDQNTAKLILGTFYKMADANPKRSITAADITKYLRAKFGDVWRTSALTSKAEDTLNQSVDLGFLERKGDTFLTYLARGSRCGRRRRRRRRRRRCRRRRSRRRRSRSRCRRRKSSCRKRSRCRRRRRVCKRRRRRRKSC